MYIIRPQDYLQFRYLSRHRPSVDCTSNIVIFTFVKWDNLTSSAADDKTLASTITIPCSTWPLGNVLFKLCADSNDSTGDDGTASEHHTGLSSDESHVTTLDDQPSSETTAQDAVSLMASKLSSFSDVITRGTNIATPEGTGTPSAYGSTLSTSENGNLCNMWSMREIRIQVHQGAIRATQRAHRLQQKLPTAALLAAAQ